MRIDVAIIGAGPAGCAAAIRARQAGLTVSIIDINREPKISPGETLHPGIEPLLKQLGVYDEVLHANFRRHHGIWTETEGTKYFAPYGADNHGPWLGFQAIRQKLHQILQQAAMNSGAQLHRGMIPERTITDGNKVVGIKAGGSKFLARWTIDATGRSAWLARELALPVRRFSPPLRARFGWHDKKDQNSDGQPSFMFRKDGWDWHAPITEDRVAWVKLRIDESYRRVHSGADLSWQSRATCAGPGFFLLGDAAATLDPASSHGVLRALMSGILSGYLMECCVHRNASETKIASIYRAWLRSSFEHDEKRLRHFYADSPAGQRFGTYLFQDKI